MVVTNFILFQLGWLLTIFSAAEGQPVVGVIYTVSWMIVHLFIIGDKYKVELQLLLIAALLGYLFDSALVAMNIIAFPAQTHLGGPSTLWMVCLWVNLAATLNYSLVWLKGRYLLAAVTAAIAGPLAYAAGEKLGAITLLGNLSLIAISVTWCLAMPLLFWIAELLLKRHSFQAQAIAVDLEKSS